jgi:hypothetical protein
MINLHGIGVNDGIRANRYGELIASDPQSTPHQFLQPNRIPLAHQLADIHGGFSQAIGGCTFRRCGFECRSFSKWLIPLFGLDQL